MVPRALHPERLATLSPPWFWGPNQEITYHIVVLRPKPPNPLTHPMKHDEAKPIKPFWCCTHYQHMTSQEIHHTPWLPITHHPRVNTIGTKISYNAMNQETLEPMVCREVLAMSRELHLHKVWLASHCSNLIRIIRGAAMGSYDRLCNIFLVKLFMLVLSAVVIVRDFWCTFWSRLFVIYRNLPLQTTELHHLKCVMAWLAINMIVNALKLVQFRQFCYNIIQKIKAQVECP